MQRWVSILLLVSFVRLQLVCCCGAMGHCIETLEESAVSEHCCGHAHGLVPHSQLENASELTGDIADKFHCDSHGCDGDSHSHHCLYLVSRGFIGVVDRFESQPTVVVHQFIANEVWWFFQTKFLIHDSQIESIQLGLGCRTLLFLAQLRI